MLPQRITVIALAAAAAVLVAVAAILAADASRADACPTTDPACTRVVGSIRVYLPAIEPVGPPLHDPTPTPDPPPDEVIHAVRDAAEPLPSQIDGPTTCARLRGEDLDMLPNSPEEQELRAWLFALGPEGRAEGYPAHQPGTPNEMVDTDHDYGWNVTRARIRALHCNTADPRLAAINACIRWGVSTPGILHASPLTGVVNARSMFWVSGLLAAPDREWRLGAEGAADDRCDSANGGAACIWNAATSPSTDGVWLLDGGQFTYTATGGDTHTVTCDAAGGILDRGHPTGRMPATQVEQVLRGDPSAPVRSGARLSSNSNNPVVPHELALGTWIDTNGNGIRDVDPLDRDGHDPDQHLEGNVHILRRLNPEGLGAYIYLDFGPWIWGYEESASTDQRLYDDSTPLSTPPTGPRGPGWDALQYFIDNTATVSARGETLTASEGRDLDALICDPRDPRHASCLAGYSGPAHVYDAHGLHRLHVLVGRTMGTKLTGYASHIDFTLDDVYTWIEVWPTTKQDVRLTSWEPRADCSTSADANEHLGSTCNTTRYKTEWTPTLADTSLANRSYTFLRPYSRCSRPANTGVSDPPPPPPPTSSVQYGGTYHSGNTECSCKETAIYVSYRPDKQYGPDICPEPPGEGEPEPDPPLECQQGPEILQHTGYSWSCSGGPVWASHTNALTAGHCSGPDQAIIGSFNPNDPQAQTAAENVKPTSTNVIGGITAGLGANDSLLGEACEWARTARSYEHRHHAYWSCEADAVSPVTLDHTWYFPPIGGGPTTSATNGNDSPVQPADKCRARHEFINEVPGLTETPPEFTIGLPPTDIPDVRVIYACPVANAGGPYVCPDTCGTADGVDAGYPVIRREPILARDPTRDASLNPTGCLPGTPVGDGQGGSTPPPPGVGTDPPGGTNDAPAFEAGDRAFTIDENSVARTPVGNAGGEHGRLIATDPDGDPLTYELGDCRRVFRVDPRDGLIMVLSGAPLDYETTSSYTCTVRVSDPDFAYDETDITVTINDVEPEDHAVVFSPASFTFSIGEHARPGDAAGTVTATGDGHISYALTRSGATSASNHFAIDAPTGQVTVRERAVLDEGTKSSYTLTATATDTNGNTATAPVTITVTSEPDVVAAPTLQHFDRVLTGSQIRYWAEFAAPPGGGSRTYSLAREATDGSGEWVIERIDGPSADATTSYEWWASASSAPWLAVRVRVHDTAGGAWSAPLRCEGASDC